jgi:peroxiredoxin
LRFTNAGRRPPAARFPRVSDVADRHTLPPDLPVPQDDGAADHLPGRALPAISLPASTGGEVDLAGAAAGTLALYVYPRTGRPGESVPPGWDDVPGARGCTVHNCTFRDRHAELSALGAALLGLSAQPHDEQTAFAAREHIPYPLLSDPGLRVAGALDLPTFEFGGARLYKRLSLIARGGTIEAVFYPVFPPGRDADDALRWLREHPAP